MNNNIFDYNDGDFAFSISDNMAMDINGNLMMRVGDNMAMDMSSGELHVTSSWSDSSSWNNNLFDENDV